MDSRIECQNRFEILEIDELRPIEKRTRTPSHSSTSMVSVLRIATLNVNGIADKVADIANLMKRANIHVLAIQETWLKSENSFYLPPYQIIRKDKLQQCDRGEGGLMFCIQPEWQVREVHPKDQLDRSLWIELRTPSGTKFQIGNVYGKNEKVSVEERRQVFQSLENNITEMKVRGPTILLGDMNARIGNQHKRAGKWGEETVSSNGNLLLELLDSSKLICLNNRFEGPTQYTRRVQSSESVLDYIIVEEELERLILSTNVQNDSEVGSDHLPVIAELRLDNQSKKKEKQVIKKWKLEKLKEQWKETRSITIEEAYTSENKLQPGVEVLEIVNHQDHQQQYQQLQPNQRVKASVSGRWYRWKLNNMLQQELKEILSKMTSLSNDETSVDISEDDKRNHLEQLWTLWRDAVTRSMMQVIGKKKVTGNSKSWWDEEVKSAIQERQHQYQQTTNDHSEESWKEYKILRKKVKSLCKRKKAEAWSNLTKKAMKASKKKDLKQFWNLVNRMGRRRQKTMLPTMIYKDQSNSETTSSNEEAIQVWKDYFFKLGNPNDDQSQQFDNNWKEIIEQEVQHDIEFQKESQ